MAIIEKLVTWNMLKFWNFDECMIVFISTHSNFFVLHSLQVKEQVQS
jgi:hypothetical protein